METKTGTIQSIAITEGNGAKGAYKMYVFNMIDGKKYNTFDEAIGTGGFKAGDFVEIDGEQNGKFWNMTAMRKSSNNQNKASTSPANASNEVSRDKVIIAQCLTKCYAEIVSVNPTLLPDAVKNQLLNAYNFFLNSI